MELAIIFVVVVAIVVVIVMEILLMLSMEVVFSVLVVLVVVKELNWIVGGRCHDAEHSWSQTNESIKLNI